MPQGAPPRGYQRADGSRATLAVLRQLIATSALAVAALLGASAALSCDQGAPRDESGVGPPIHLVATNIDQTHTLPVDGEIVLAFDRLLSPFTVTRQSVAFRDAFNQAPVSPIVIYNPVARTVTVSSPSPGQPWMLENQVYKIILPVPKDPSDIGGLRAIDGATLEKTLVFEFLTTKAAGPKVVTRVSCSDVLPIFQDRLRGCNALSACHGAPDQNDASPPMGMILTTGSGLRNTAIGRPSELMNRGASARVSPPAKIFGADMAIVQPGNAGSSMLIYKLLAWGEPPAGTLQDMHVPLADDEAARLRELLGGQPMPPPILNDALRNDLQHLSYDDASLIASWISQGAKTDDCP